MAVAVNLIPVTGQPLPLISRGGTSTLITCAYFGLILSADRFGIGKKKEPLVSEVNTIIDEDVINEELITPGIASDQNELENEAVVDLDDKVEFEIYKV